MINKDRNNYTKFIIATIQGRKEGFLVLNKHEEKVRLALIYSYNASLVNMEFGFNNPEIKESKWFTFVVKPDMYDTVKEVLVKASSVI